MVEEERSGRKVNVGSSRSKSSNNRRGVQVQVMMDVEIKIQTHKGAIIPRRNLFSLELKSSDIF